MYLVDGSLSLAACILMAGVMWWFAHEASIVNGIANSGRPFTEP